MKDVETLIYMDPEGLIDQVNDKIREAESILQGGKDPQFHDEILSRMGTQSKYERFQRSGAVFIHYGMGGTVSWKIPSYALLKD